MAFQRSILWLIIFLLILFQRRQKVFATNVPSQRVSVPFNRTLFPSDFLFGAGASAYQTEGAWNEDGKGPSIWDTFTHNEPEKIADQKNGDVALDFYHRYKEDIKLAKFEGLDSLRFSIAWSRILPQGKISKGINWAGINFYNNVIDETIAQGIKPFITLFHWDVPQVLEDEYLGFLSPNIVGDYLDFVDICFNQFGDRVKHWTTINEPYTFSIMGYDYGIFAPGRCSPWRTCSFGNSSTEPYIVAHNLLLAHAAATNLYRQKYQARQKGEIGIVLFSQWFEPYSRNSKDIRASRRAIDFMLGWFLHPLVYGDYPENMKGLIRTRLPNFTLEEKQLLRGSFDFIGLNYYTSYYAAHLSSPLDPAYTSVVTDNHVNQSSIRNGELIGYPTGALYSYTVPWGLPKLLHYVKRHYKNPVVYITECGMADANITTVENGANDTTRVEFLKTHILATYNAFKLGVKVKGFFVWSLHDNFEWRDGYTLRYGINFIDYNDSLKRYPKHSAFWIKEFLLKSQVKLS